MIYQVMKFPSLGLTWSTQMPLFLDVKSLSFPSAPLGNVWEPINLSRLSVLSVQVSACTEKNRSKSYFNLKTVPAIEAKQKVL